MIKDKITLAAQLPSRLTGWKRNLFAFSLGICATLTLAPFFLFPLLIPSFTGLFLLIKSASNSRRAFLDGWWWGWGFYMTGLYWFCVALLTDPEHFAWLIPFALFLVTAFVALYSGIAALIAFKMRMRGITGILVFATVWTGVEYARGHLLTGFPWNLMGYSLGFSDWSLQLASLIGAYGMTWLAVLLGSSWAALSESRKGTLFVTAVFGLFALGMGWGAWRLHEADQIPENERYVPGVMLRLVQANISQPHKWDPQLQLQGVRQQVRLTRTPGIDKVTHVIWSETAVPYAIEAGSPLVHELGSAIPAGKILITGGLRVEGEDRHYQIWNSMVAVDHNGTMVGSYDKSKLVPFGEFLPFRRFIPKAWLTPVGDMDFSWGSGMKTETWPGLPPLSPLICYEVIFPESVVDTASAERPQLLLNVTNDAWFGKSTGPYQHFEMSRMRAVEQGIPLVRAANTGISAVVDSYGRVVAKLPLGEQGVLDYQLPKAQNTYTTYDRYSSVIILSLLLMTVLLHLSQGKRTK